MVFFLTEVPIEFSAKEARFHFKFVFLFVGYNHGHALIMGNYLPASHLIWRDGPKISLQLPFIFNICGALACIQIGRVYSTAVCKRARRCRLAMQLGIHVGAQLLNIPEENS